jgi:SAM-dependent methyltransferase
MINSQPPVEPPGACSHDFWDALAPHLDLIEDNYFDLRSVRLLLNSLHDPVLVIGAGQGLIVAELRNRGFRCDGIDSSPEMVRHANLRRGITLIQADARALPFAPGVYKTIIYATGVLDFIAEEQAIRAILNEGRRITNGAGTIFAAFYRLSDAQEQFVKRVGLLANHQVRHRESLEVYLLNPREMVAWVARRAGVSPFRAIAILLWMSVRCRPRDLRTTIRMQRIFRDAAVAQALINAAPPQQPYRNAAEIINLFQRLGIPIQEFLPSPSCFIVKL